jgi:hypothetical protein
MHKMPSLDIGLEEAIEETYEIARLRASAETGIARTAFPPSCPFSREEILSETFLPE